MFVGYIYRESPPGNQCYGYNNYRATSVILDQVGLLITITGSPHQVANVADITITEPPPVILDQIGLLVTVTGSPHQIANVTDITITEPPSVTLDQVGLLVTVTGVLTR